MFSAKQMNFNPLVRKTFEQGQIFGKQIKIDTIENDLGKEITPLEFAGSALHGTYLDGMKWLAKKGMRYASNVLHDRYLIETDKWKPLNAQNYYPAWCREVLACFGGNVPFPPGLDFICDISGWVLPAEYIPEVATEEPFISLLITPREFTLSKDGERVILHPESIHPIRRLVSHNWISGVVDRATRLPLESNVDEHQINWSSMVREPHTDMVRWLAWNEEQGSILPLARSAGINDNRYVIFAETPTMGYGIGGVPLVK